MKFNPWATSRTEPEIAVQEYAEPVSSRYSVPKEGDAPYTDEFGWAPTMRQSPTGIPDTSRLGLSAPRSPVQGNPNDAPQGFWRGIDSDRRIRHSVEEIDANGWNENKDFPGYPNPGGNRWAANPRSVPPPESRITQLLSPRTYSFLRPFAGGQPKMGARYFNGMHFSMADNKRNYDILGMAPVRSWRNTYRLTPEPWDTDVIDMPPVADNVAVPEARYDAVDVPYPSRSWRLG